MLCAAGDWLQGPYVYALYQHYGFDRGDIGRLFIAGFGSSMVFGTVVGALADRTCVLHAACTAFVGSLSGVCLVIINPELAWWCLHLMAPCAILGAESRQRH